MEIQKSKKVYVLYYVNSSGNIYFSDVYTLLDYIFDYESSFLLGFENEYWYDFVEVNVDKINKVVEIKFNDENMEFKNCTLSRYEEQSYNVIKTIRKKFGLRKQKVENDRINPKFSMINNWTQGNIYFSNTDALIESLACHEKFDSCVIYKRWRKNHYVWFEKIKHLSTLVISRATGRISFDNNGTRYRNFNFDNIDSWKYAFFDFIDHIR